jgi:hypothetical protein
MGDGEAAVCEQDEEGRNICLDLRLERLVLCLERIWLSVRSRV